MWKSIEHKLFRLRYLVLVVALVACGGALGTHTAGGESHFLRQCSQNCGDGLECVSGVCTRGCLVAEGGCGDLAPGAICTDASIEPGAIAVCDVSCEGDSSCAALGADFSCADGFCRGPALLGGGTSNNAGSSNAGSGSSSAGTSSAGASSAGSAGQASGGSGRVFRTPPCSGFGTGTPCPAGFVCHTDPRTALGTDPTYLCAQEYRSEVCSPVADGECGDGFECVDEGNGGTCAADRVNCWSSWGCPNLPAACPYGYALSRTGVQDGFAQCTGPCVPITRCGCSSDQECPDGAVCDVLAGDCVALLPWQPPPQCALPFDFGLCDDYLRVFAAVDGVCTEQRYGGCEGNDNRFSTLEACLAVCEGRPDAHPCPEGRAAQSFCPACGVVGGCQDAFMGCGQTCSDSAECDFGTCSDGICQAGMCF
jgi:hypothetical protein